MEQYIPKSALAAEMEKCYNECLKRAKITDPDYWNAKADAYRNVLVILNDALEVKEVDLEKELVSWRHNHFHGRRDKEASGEYLERVSQLDLAKHFFGLGLNTQHSSINIPNIDDILEESGIDPLSKEAKIFKESYYMALEKLKAQKGE